MLSDQIRKYRKEKGLSQDELAEKLGVSRQSISLWENGQTQPTIENILALARIFNVSTDAILGNTEEVITIPRQSRGFFIDGPSPLLLATRHVALVRSDTCVKLLLAVRKRT